MKYLVSLVWLVWFDNNISIDNINVIQKVLKNKVVFLEDKLQNEESESKCECKEKYKT